MCAYALRITDLDPIPNGLIFERFLNPERPSIPDFDVDFDERRRGEVSRDVTQKYGEERVAQIVTYGTIKAASYAMLLSVPLAVLAIPVFLIWSEWQLVNSLWGLVLLYVAVNLPFTIWLLYGFVLQVPVELEEAAAIDGCGPLRVFTKVLLPLMAPGLAAASIFTFRIAWNEFILALVLTDRQTRTLPVAASLFITDIGVDWGRVMAMGSLIAIPPLIFTFVAARQIITGLTAGAVKG
jgi:multiple sugar transport system permease protein